MKKEFEWISQCLKYISEEISDVEFETYINTNKNIEKELDPDDYLDLISRNYTNGAYKKEIEALLRKYNGQYSIEVEKIKAMLAHLINEVGDPAEIICKLYNIMGNHVYVYDLAIHTVLGVDELPRLSEKKNWDLVEFENKRKWFQEALPRYKKMAQTILDSFDDGSLKIEENDVIQSDSFRTKMAEFDIRKA